MTGGVDRLANGFTYASPSGLFFLLMPPWLAFATVLTGHLFLSTYFTYRLSRDELQLGDIPSVWAGAAVATVHGVDVLAHQWGYSAFPFVIWAVNRAVEAPGARSWLLMALLGLGYSAVSSMATSLPFCLVALAGWFLIVQRRAAPLFWSKAALFGLAAALPQAQVAWAMWINAPWSHRADWARPEASWAAFGGFLRDAWGWVLSCKIPLAMAFVGVWTTRKAGQHFRGVLALFLGVTVGVAALRVLLLAQSGRLDFLNGFQFLRFHLLTPFFATLLGAIGLNALPAGRAARRWLLAFSVATLVWGSLAVKANSVKAWALTGSFAANLRAGVFHHLPPSDQPYRVATLPHGLHPAYANAMGVETVDGYNNLYPKAYQRFWERVIEPAGRSPGMSSMVQLLRDWGNRVYLVLDAVPEYPEPVRFGAYYRLNLLSLANMRYVLSLHPLEAPGLVPVRESSGPPTTLRGKILARLRDNLRGRRRAFVYENVDVLPRAFVATRVKGFTDERSFWTALSAAPGAGLRETVYALESRAEALRPSATPAISARARIARYSPDRVEVDVELDGSGVLVLSNTFSPFWKAAVDGAPRAIVPAYETFWAVPVTKNDRRVVFTYEPPYRLSSLAFWKRSAS